MPALALLHCTGNGENLDEPGLDASGAGLAVRGSSWIRLDPAASKAAAGHAAALDSAMPVQLLTAPLDATPAVWLSQPGRAASYTGRRLPSPHLFPSLANHSLASPPPSPPRDHPRVLAGLAPGALPPSLSLMTTQSLGANQLLVRVQHLFETGEDPVLSGA